MSTSGAPPHWGLEVRRDGPTPFLPRSPDVTPFDFFLQGYVKDNIYKSTFNDIREFKIIIVDVVSSVNGKMLNNVKLQKRLHSLRSKIDAHLEIY